MKSILIVEDNKMVLEITSKALQRENFVTTNCENAEQAIKLLQKNTYDLIITDLHLENLSGHDLIDYIRIDLNLEVPIMVLSSDGDDVNVIQALVKGANDYAVKPLSIAQLLVRTKKLLGLRPDVSGAHKNLDSVINKKRVGIVIPCYNEADRLLTDEFTRFIEQNTSYTLLFVNDGSKDDTLQVLKRFEMSNPQYIEVLDLDQNSGKAEAVRQGVLHLHEQDVYDYVGFLDADLSTDFSDMSTMIDEINSSKVMAVVGSRITRVGADIHKSDSRAIISSTINKLINALTKMSFKDTQCGAKVFDKDVIDLLFGKPFASSWLFDVELFVRLRLNYGKKVAQELIIEHPLKKWLHVEGSKLSWKDSFKIFGELLGIYTTYNKIPSASRKRIEKINSMNWYNYHKEISRLLSEQGLEKYC